MEIPFNKPYVVGSEQYAIEKVITSRKLSGNGAFTKKVHQWFIKKYNFQKVLLTTSCTDALEMAALAIDIKKDDEIIIPSYTFVSTANAFALQGAKIVFADSRTDHPGIDEDRIEALITPKTKAIVVVHYAGVSVDFIKIQSIIKKYNLILIEDAAQAIDSFYYDQEGNKTALGSYGDFATFSFHETKNINCGEGGLLVVNNLTYSKIIETIWEKGTNRSSFFRGEIDKYGWVSKGSSFLPSEIIAAFLYEQLKNLEDIQQKRINIWESYYRGIEKIEQEFELDIKPRIPHYAHNNAHMFYLILRSNTERDALMEHLKSNGIHAVFHYQSLHKSSFAIKNKWDSGKLLNSDKYTDLLLRLPLFPELVDVEFILNQIKLFFENQRTLK